MGADGMTISKQTLHVVEDRKQMVLRVNLVKEAPSQRTNG